MTTIDRIMNKLRNFYVPADEKYIRQILEAEIPAVNGVDELVEKRTKAEGVVANSGYILVDEFIFDLKSLKQTPVASQPNKTIREWRIIDGKQVILEREIDQPTQERLKDSKPKEVLLGEDTPYKEDLGCRIYGYVNDGKVNITRVEYTGTRGIG